jgi:iron complex outermembrane recepter protein
MKSWRFADRNKCCARSLKIYLWLLLVGITLISDVLARSGRVLASDSQQNKIVTRIKTVSETDFPATSVKDLLSQSPTPDTQSTVVITGVKANPTDKGVEVILETTLGEQLQLTNRSEGNNFIADIPNAQLRLPNGDAFTFSSEKPIEGITQISVTNIDANTVRVTVAGEKAVPTVELFDGDEGLIFAVVSTTTSAQPPQTPQTEEPPATQQPEEPTAQQDEPIELVVTGEQDGYRVPDTSVGTRTDTPLRDIPQSIQVIPRQVIQDTQAGNITQALENVPGLIAQGSGAANTRDYFTARGFEQYDALVNGLQDHHITSDGNIFNVERIEVLRGPASVLYGDSGNGSVGALINYVTRRPLSNPFFEVEASVGNYGFYQGTIDVSGPLNPARSTLGRLIVGYRNYDSPVEFATAKTFGVAPSFSFQLSSKANLIVEGDVNIMERNFGSALPVVGTVLPNPNGKIRFGFNPGGPLDDTETIINGRVGYEFEYQFSDNLKLRNAFRYNFAFTDTNGVSQVSSTSLDADNRTLNRTAYFYKGDYNYYLVDTNLLGNFKTGEVEHQVLFGFSLSRYDIGGVGRFGIPMAPVDIFNPVYDQRVTLGDETTNTLTTTDVAGLYVQNQITLQENLKLLLGGRFDFSENRRIDRLANTESSQSNTAFSPRVGIVYQPIEPISLYASYGRSFNPLTGRAFSGEFLLPERGTQYEVGVKADITSRLTANLALYDLTRSNVTTSDPDNPGFSVQSGKQRSRGIELDVSGEIMPGWNIIAGYAYTDARILEDNDIPVGNRLFNAPEHAVNLWTTYRIQSGAARGLGFGLGLYYIGDRPIDNANTVNLPGFVRTDAAIFYERDQFRAALNIRNLFDVENYVSNYGSSDFVHIGTPFTIQGTLSWRF